MCCGGWQSKPYTLWGENRYFRVALHIEKAHICPCYAWCVNLCWYLLLLVVCTSPSVCGTHSSHFHWTECGANQHYKECGSACEITCSNRNNPPAICPAVCIAGCFCDEGFIKTEDGSCVREIQCEQSKPIYLFLTFLSPVCPLACHPKGWCHLVCEDYLVRRHVVVSTPAIPKDCHSPLFLFALQCLCTASQKSLLTLKLTACNPMKDCTGLPLLFYNRTKVAVWNILGSEPQMGADGVWMSEQSKMSI